MERLTRRAAFLDRDGTINRRPPEHRYVTRLDEFELLPGAVEGMADLASCGHLLVVISNQRGIGRGLIGEDVLRATERVLQDSLSAHEAEISAFYYCPHLIEDGCDCRKPKPGMLLQAAAELELELGSSWMIGDSPSDVEAGSAAGCRTVALGKADGSAATLSASSLREAAELICSWG